MLPRRHRRRTCSTLRPRLSFAGSPIPGGVSNRDIVPEHHGDRGGSLQSLRRRGMALTEGGSSADAPPYLDLTHQHIRIVTMRSPWTCPAPQAVVWPPLPVQATRAALGTGRPELDRRLHCAVHCRHTTLLLLTAVALCPAAFAGEPFPWHAFKRLLTIASPSCPSPPCSIPHDRARMRVVYAVS
jgi:hypothetical protein